MGHDVEKIFQKRFQRGIEVAYCDCKVDGAESQLIQKRICDAVKAAMAAVLKREPTQEEFLGIKPIEVLKKKGGICNRSS